MMGRLRFSLVTLMGFVVVVAVGCAALRSASKLWASTIFTVTVGLLSVAIIGAIFLGGRERAFCTGAAILGWVYLALAFAPWFRPNVGTFLLTTSVLDFIREKLPATGKLSNPAPGVPISELQLATEGRLVDLKAPGTTITVSDPSVLQASVSTSFLNVTAGSRPGVADLILKKPDGTQQVLRFTVKLDEERFTRIGHSLAALLAALTGGALAWYFYGLRESRRAPRSDGPSGP